MVLMPCLSKLIFRSLPDCVCNSTTLREGPVSASALANGMVLFVFWFALRKGWSMQIGFLSDETKQEGALQNHI